MKRFMSFMLALLLVLGSFFAPANSVYAKEATKTEEKKAVVESVEFTKDRVTTGDALVASLTLNEEIKADILTLTFIKPVTEEEMRLLALRGKGQEYTSFDLVKDDFENGDYILKSVEDSSGKKIDLKKDLKPFFTVYGTKGEEVIKPVVDSVSFSKKNLNLNDKAVILVGLENESKMEEITLYFKKPITKELFAIKAKQTDDKKFMAVLEVSNDMENGKYEFSFLSGTDEKLNMVELKKDLLVEGFTVKGTSGADIKSPVVKSIDLDKKTYRVNETIQALVEIEEEDSIDEIKLVFLGPDKKNYSVTAKKVGKTTYRADHKIEEDASLGSYIFSLVSGKDKAGNPVVCDDTIKLPSFNLEKADKKAMEVESITTDKKNYGQGERAKFSAKIKNAETIKVVYLEYFLENTKENILVKLEENGKGVFEGERLLDKNTKLGSYKLFRVVDSKTSSINIGDKVEGNFNLVKDLYGRIYEDIKLDPKDYGAISLEIESKDLVEKDKKNFTYTPMKEGNYLVKFLDKDKLVVDRLIVKVVNDPALYKEEYKEEKVLLYKTIRQINPDLLEGQTKLVREGKNGLEAEVTKIKFRDGKEVARVNVGRQVVEEPVDELIEVGSKEDLNDYISRGVNVRDLKGEKIGYLDAGTEVRGKNLGSHLEITYKGKTARVDKKYLTLVTVENFVSKGVNVRNLKGEKIGYLSLGSEVIGRDLGKVVEIDYDGQKARLSKNFLQVVERKNFVSKGVNVRNSKGEKLGYLKAGQVIEGRDLYNRVEIDYKGERALIDRRFVRSYELKTFTSKGVKVRDDKGQLLGYLKRGTKIKGYDLGSRIEIEYKGERAFIAKLFVE